jgi:hypothetical protein
MTKSAPPKPEPVTESKPAREAPSTKPYPPIDYSNISEPDKKEDSAMKRTASGGIMSAFAKAPPKRQKPQVKQEEYKPSGRP